MCECFSFILHPWRTICKPAILSLLASVQKRHLVYIPAVQVEVSEGFDSDTKESSDVETSLLQFRRKHMRSKSWLHSLRTEENGESSKGITGSSIWEGPPVKVQTCKSQKRYVSNGGTETASLFTKEGLKGINQDTMLVIETFASMHDAVLCGVFDGHGQDGHLVARNVRDTLPQILASAWRSQQQADRPLLCQSLDGNKDHQAAKGWFSEVVLMKEMFEAAFKLTDRELLMNCGIDCITSGSTAVVLLKQGNDLVVGNVGDSRAILGVRTDEGDVHAVQLTIDSKPNIPREAERIKRYDGRVFALQREPSVHRVWLPHRNMPGLAMSRALGDYCVKSHGVISVPEVTYRHLTRNDEFVVLATDGVWDVLSNQEVAELVSSTRDKALAARVVVESAMRVWRCKYALSKADDCAVVCLFLSVA